MSFNFRKHHCLELLELNTQLKKPLDVLMSNYFRQHKAIGSKDRKWISETLYAIVRWQGKLDAKLTQPITFEKRLEAFLENQHQMDLENVEPHVEVSFPKKLFQMLQEQFGAQTKELCLTLNEKAPTTLRTNLLKITREELLEILQPYYPKASPLTKTAIHMGKKCNFFILDAFKQGYFEVQDEGSQLICEKIQLPEKAHVLDFCAGSGGKTLALAPQLSHGGQFYLHDIREWVLDEAKKRCKRAGVQNVQFVPPSEIKKLKGKMDAVLCDVPCSGLGTLRRNPDLKWKFTQEKLDALLKTQESILQQAAQFLKPKGQLIYMTCSVLLQENKDQIHSFLEKNPQLTCSLMEVLLPQSNGHDGFFIAILEK
ncbi:MAG: Ribosomal RNA small subunit methyltransferase B [Chlamydiae bacterium]|nr:Ribosomal RNA small subunit methyltransferase B [Chlamydiota bacterium]